MNNEYQPIIGLETHVELYTKSKMFCRCSAMYFGKKPNTHTCPICLGLPGALPYPNQKAIDYCIMIALALNCKISDFSYFERKNYFYPDLPKGYQITQYKDPFGYEGYLNIKIKERVKRIKIRRVHMEEDTAKLVHESGISNKKNNHTLIDFNRSGVPLVEIVTEPDFATGEEAKIFLTELQKIIRYLDVSEADMEKGDMRLEPNISLISLQEVNQFNNEAISKGSSLLQQSRASNEKKQLPKYKVEVKNINSFRFVEKAINYEIDRQIKILKNGAIPVQETRGWNETKSATVSQRIKEEAHDYRYFPEPDLPPIRFSQDQISRIKNKLPELPGEKIARFLKNYGLTSYDAEILTREKETANFFEKAIKLGRGQNVTPKQIANTIINKKIEFEKTSPLELIKSITTSTQTQQIDENELNKIIKEVINENFRAVEDYKKGKTQVIGYLIGMVNKKLQNMKINTNLIKEKLEKLLI